MAPRKDHTSHIKLMIVIINSGPITKRNCPSLLVALACLLGSNLALGVLNSPGQQQTESHTSHLLVLHAVEELLADLLAGLRRRQTESAGNLCCTRQEVVKLSKCQNTSGPAVALSEDGQKELIQRCMCTGSWVGDCFLQMSQILMLTVLLNVVVINICFDVNGCHFSDQVVCGPIHKLFKTNPTAGRALAEIKHVKHGLTGGCAALHCAILFLPAWGQTKTARQRGNVLAQGVKFSRIDFAILVNISVAKAHSKHSIELTAGCRVLLGSCLSAPCQKRVLIVPPSV